MCGGERSSKLSVLAQACDRSLREFKQEDQEVQSPCLKNTKHHQKERKQSLSYLVKGSKFKGDPGNLEDLISKYKVNPAQLVHPRSLGNSRRTVDGQPGLLQAPSDSRGRALGRFRRQAQVFKSISAPASSHGKPRLAPVSPHTADGFPGLTPGTLAKQTGSLTRRPRLKTKAGSERQLSAACRQDCRPELSPGDYVMERENRLLELVL